jgi:nitroreductase
VDTWLAIASKRDVREYAETPVPADVVMRILDAGRLSGSARNRQQWEFVVVETKQAELAEVVHAPANVLGARLVVAIVGEARGMDVGRCAQNMMLAAWNDGIGSCPAHLPEAELGQLLGVPADLHVNRVIGFGYIDPARTAAPTSVARVRKSLAELVHYDRW